MAIRKIPEDTKWFKYHNENPKDNRTGDCVVRAIATLTGQSWDKVLTDLMVYALKYKMMPNDVKCYDKYLSDLGYKKQKQPRKDDNKKFTGKEFVEIFKGECVAHIGGHHIVCIKKHKVHDIWDSTEGCIGNYWTK